MPKYVCCRGRKNCVRKLVRERYGNYFAGATGVVFSFQPRVLCLRCPISHGLYNNVLFSMNILFFF